MNSTFTEGKKVQKDSTAPQTAEPEVIENDTVYLSDEDKAEAERIKMLRRQADNIVSNMHKSIDGLGTDDALFEKTLSKVNKDNVLEVLDLWDRTYGKEYGETFFESFLSDASGSQRKEYAPKLLDALKQRADAEGIGEHPMFKAQVEKFEKALNSRFIGNQGKLAESFNEMQNYLLFPQACNDGRVASGLYPQYALQYENLSLLAAAGDEYAIGRMEMLQMYKAAHEAE